MIVLPYRIIIYEIYSYLRIRIRYPSYMVHNSTFSTSMLEGKSDNYVNQHMMIMSLYGYFSRDPSRKIWKLYTHMSYIYIPMSVPTANLYYPVDSLHVILGKYQTYEIVIKYLIDIIFVNNRIIFYSDRDEDLVDRGHPPEETDYYYLHEKTKDNRYVYIRK